MRNFAGDKNKSGRFSRGDRFKRRDSGRSSFKKMHQVVCDRCKKNCEVPFKPTAGKPVYCSDCFRKDESPRQESRSGYGSSRRHGSREGPSEFQQINAKLDRILEMLNDD